MILLQTIASNLGFREPAANGLRTARFRDLLTLAVQQSAEILLLPGGFWTVNDVTEVEPLVESLSTEAREAGITVIAGVDVQGKSSKTGGSKGDRYAALPFFGFAGGQAGGPRLWQQTSSTSENAWDVPDEDVPGAARIVQVGESRVGVLICGELFSRRARTSIAGLAPTLVVDLGHESMGTGVTRAMERIATDGGCAVAHTHHVTSYSGASLHFVTNEVVRESISRHECPTVGDEDFWVAWRVRSF